MKDSFDYGRNPLKTRNGELLKSYMCDHETAYAEFELSKAKYKAITDREQKKDKDVLYCHKWQAFLPGEIAHDGALEIEYETAMRWTKDKHAFLWCRILTGHIPMYTFIIIQSRSTVPGNFGIFLDRCGRSGGSRTEYALKTAYPLLRTRSSTARENISITENGRAAINR